MAQKIAKKTKLSYRATSAILVIIFFLIIATITSFAIYRLVSEISKLIDKLTADPETISGAIDTFMAKLQKLGEKFAFIKHITSSEAFEKLGLDLDAILPEILRSLVSSLTGSLPSAAVSFAAKLPEALLFLVVLLLSSYYFCADREKISSSFAGILPDKWVRKLPTLRDKLSDTLRGYLKAYLSIMLLTFFEIFLGLTILGVDYAFLLGVIIAVVDILPVLGTGTVLIPWAIFSFAVSNPRLGTGLIILYAVVLIVRQLVEPKIVGNTLGLHPLATLASLYVGIKFLGFAGIFIGPIIAMLLGGFFKNAETEEEAAPKEIKKPNLDIT